MDRGERSQNKTGSQEVKQEGRDKTLNRQEYMTVGQERHLVFIFLLW